MFFIVVFVAVACSLAMVDRAIDTVEDGAHNPLDVFHLVLGCLQ